LVRSAGPGVYVGFRVSAFIKIPEPVLLDHEYVIPSVSVASETVYD
jgi:hypothetical protein